MDTVSLYQRLPEGRVVVSTKIRRDNETALHVLIHKFLPRIPKSPRILRVEPHRKREQKALKKKIIAIIGLTYFFIGLSLFINMNYFLKAITKNT